MAWPFADGMIKVVITYGFEGEPAINVHFVWAFSDSSPIGDGALLEVANLFHTAWSRYWIDRANNGWRINDITALDYSRDGGGIQGTTETLPLVAVNTGEALPAQITTVISHRTDRTGRSYRGRNYVPGLGENNVDRNDANVDWVNDLTATYSDLRLDLVQADYEQVVYSLYHDGQPRLEPVHTRITGTIVNSRVDTQRRRLPN